MLPNHFPTPRIFHPGTGEPELRWGVVGPGWIAGIFVDTVSANTRQRFTAVGSRSIGRAESFARDHGIDAAYGSIDELVDSPDVDVVYVATPPDSHVEIGLRAIAAGKHLLIEKPLAMNAADADRLAESARRAGVFLMEGMWSRYLPQASVIRSLLDDGVFGEVRSLQADHGQVVPSDTDHRLFHADLGGGALLDIGIYPVAFSSFVLGVPERIRALGALTASGVDAHSTLVLTHPGDAQATIVSSITSRTPGGAYVAGSEARMSMIGSINGPASLTLADNGWFTPQMTWEDPTELRDLAALAWQATALAGYVSEGRLESPVHDHAETVSIIGTLAEARNQLGVGSATTEADET